MLKGYGRNSFEQQKPCGKQETRKKKKGGKFLKKFH